FLVGPLNYKKGASPCCFFWPRGQGGQRARGRAGPCTRPARKRWRNTLSTFNPIQLPQSPIGIGAFSGDLRSPGSAQNFAIRTPIAFGTGSVKFRLVRGAEAHARSACRPRAPVETRILARCNS